MYLRDKSVLSHQKADTTLGLIQSIVICFKGKEEDWAWNPRPAITALWGQK